MQMKSLLANLELFRAPRLDLLKEPLVARAAATIRVGKVEIEVDEPRDLDAVAVRIRDAFLNGRLPDRSDLRHAPWCIWGGDNALERTPEVLNAYLRHVRGSGRKGAFRRLAAAYVVRFPTDSNMLKAVGATLADLANSFQGAWSEASRSLDIFDPEMAPQRIAREALRKGVTPTNVLSDHGLSKLAATSKLAEASFLAGLDEIKKDSLEPIRRLDAIKRWSLTERNILLFDSHRGRVADALVLPHADAMPDKPQRDKMLSFLLGQFKDPRLHSSRWTPMSRRCTDTVRRWLIEQSLRQFLDVVDKNAKDTNKDYQWKYRRAFWEAVYKRGLISDACVVFDELGASTARKIFDSNTLYSRWKKVSGAKQIEEGHACLILRIGPGVVAEWSHNGRYHIWHDASDPTAPQLHKETYNSVEVMIPVAKCAPWMRVFGSHLRSDTYSWQNKVADEVFALTKTRVMQSEYVVR